MANTDTTKAEHRPIGLCFFFAFYYKEEGVIYYTADDVYVSAISVLKNGREVYNVKLGMTFDEIIAVLGEPTSIATGVIPEGTNNIPLVDRRRGSIIGIAASDPQAEQVSGGIRQLDPCEAGFGNKYIQPVIDDFHRNALLFKLPFVIDRAL